MASGIPTFVVLFFAVVIGLILITIVKGLITAVNNLGQPVIGRPARIIGRRQATSVRGGHGNMSASSSTSYYVTFEFKDGSREEFHVPDRDFGLLVEGDAGLLHSQGAWFKGFDRGSAWAEEEEVA